MPLTRHVPWLRPGRISVRGGGVHGDCGNMELFPQVCLYQLTSASAPKPRPRAVPFLGRGGQETEVLPAPAAPQLLAAETPLGPGLCGTFAWCVLSPSHAGPSPHRERAGYSPATVQAGRALHRWRGLSLPLQPPEAEAVGPTPHRKNPTRFSWCPHFE